MGLDSAWREILHENFGRHCHYTREDLGDRWLPHVVIDDMSLNLRSVVYHIDRWETVYDRLRGRLLSQWHPGLESIIVTFDEPEFVPKSKGVIQRKRKRTNLTKNIYPFTEKEIESIKINTGIPIPTSDMFMEKLVVTPEMMPDLYGFMSLQLARVKLGGPVVLTIDGGYGNYLVSEISDNPKTEMELTKATGMHDLNSESGVISAERCRSENGGGGEGEGGKKSSYYASATTVKLSLNASDNIGEGDLKIPANISKLEGTGKNVLVRSWDGDTIPILLLNMRRWMDPDTGYIRFGIFLDTTRGNGDKREIKRDNLIDVVSLWRSIHATFEKRWPGIRDPIETMVLLILLTKGDFCEGFKQLGPKRIWGAFCDGGHEILFKNSKWATPPFEEHGSNLHPDPGCSIIHSNRNSFSVDSVQSLALNEQRIYHFIALAYDRVVINEKDRPYYPESETSMQRNRRLADMKDAEAKERSGGGSRRTRTFGIPSDDEIIATIRRCWWNLDYWTNGIMAHMNPLQMVPHPKDKTEVSMCGWEYGQDLDEVEHRGRKVVVPAKKISSSSGSVPERKWTRLKLPPSRAFKRTKEEEDSSPSPLPSPKEW